MGLADSIFVALIGALIALILREVTIWIWRPKLDVDFEEFGDEKPYIHQLRIANEQPPPLARYLRLCVSNPGGRAAESCEAKLEVRHDRKLDPAVVLLHWARRDPLVYQTTDAIFAPVTINRGSSEGLDVLELRHRSQRIVSVSARQFWFEPNKKYELTVVVTSRNAAPATFGFELKWDGTWNGFRQSVF